jgi:UDP-N-acetylmuramoyl-tripeptide--D-alanyl-D-alanine ligase
LIKVPKYQLYLLQLENYELGRFWKLLFNKGIVPPKEGLRKDLVWTTKAILIFIVSDILIFLTSGITTFNIFNTAVENPAAAVAIFIGLTFILKLFSFVFFSLATLILWPVDALVKKVVISQAKNKLRKLSMNLDSRSGSGMTPKGLKVIGIAGSYGKTTMKEVLTAVLSSRYQVSSTPESVNTPVGIARWISKSVDNSTEIIIVEMGEHYKGDIAFLSSLLLPNIVVLTGINESHLERMASMENVVATIFEAVDFVKPKGLVVVNTDDKNITVNYKKLVRPGLNLAEYNTGSVKEKVFDSEKLLWKFKINELGDAEVSMLGEYILADIVGAVRIAKELGLTPEEINRGIKNIKPADHRLQPIKSAGNILVIDDSYNGNPEGVKEAIKVLSQFNDRRKIYITPGLVETGSASQEIHRNIGKDLAKVADVVILIKNSVTGYIESGIKDVIARSAPMLSMRSPERSIGAADAAIPLKNKKIASDALAMTKPQIIWFDNAPLAHNALKDILKPNDVILFQNDWGDQYL